MRRIILPVLLMSGCALQSPGAKPTTTKHEAAAPRRNRAPVSATRSSSSASLQSERARRRTPTNSDLPTSKQNLSPSAPATLPLPAARPFPGQHTVKVTELVNALVPVADSMQRTPAVRADFATLRAAHDLPDDAALLKDYVRVKLIFEAARDGGFWHLRWQVTNRQPNSEQVWRQWSQGSLRQGASPDEVGATATAECDELSALFAVLVRRLGVERVGLFWPRWNHVVAVWTVQNRNGQDVRIVVPTSQVFLERDASLDTRGFDPYQQTTIYPYLRRDVSDTHPLPVRLARFFLQQAWRYAGLPQAELQRLRNRRSAKLGGS